MKLNTIIEVPKEVEFDIASIESVYVGKPNTCMCGCSGEYYYTSWNADYAGRDRGYVVTPSEIDDEKVKTLLTLFEHGRIGNLGNQIFTTIRNETQYTIYLREAAK